MARKGPIVLLAALSLLRSSGGDLYFDEVISDHAVLQGRPLPFSLFGTSDRELGKLAVSVSGTNIKILEAEIQLSRHANETRDIFKWKLVIINSTTDFRLCVPCI